MSPAEFKRKWARYSGKETSAYQEHFNDLCALLGHPSPAAADPTGSESFCFQKRVVKDAELFALEDSGRIAEEPEAERERGFADVWKKGCFAWEYKGKKKDLDVAYRQLLRYRESLVDPPLLVELRQYVGQGIKALVPRVVGQTEAAREQKERSSPTRRSSAASGAIDEETFLASIPPSTRDFFARLLDESNAMGVHISWTAKGFNLRGTGQSPFFFCWVPAMYKRESSAMEIYFAYFKDSTVTDELRRRVTGLEHVLAVGTQTLRVFVTEETLDSARKLFEVALDFIINYDIKYRMGLSGGSGEEE